jgi:Holliday junction resolvase
MRRAAKVDATQEDIVAALRKAGASVLSLAPIGGGCPDILACKDGRAWLFEAKNPERSKKRRGPNSLQEEWHQRWSGCPVLVVLTPEQALRAIGTGTQEVKA